MKNLLLLEWRKLKWPVLIVLVLTTAVSMILSNTIYKDYALEYNLEAWEVGMEYIIFIFPLIATLPVGWLMYYEKKDHFLIYTLPRVSKRRYLLSKWLVIAGSAAITMFVVMFAGVLIALYVKPEIVPTLTMVDPVTNKLVSRILNDHFAGELFANQPLIYGLLFSVWRGILAALMATFAFVLSLYIENIFIILTGPFIYYILENFTLSIIGMPQYRFVTAIDPSTLSVNSINIFSFVVGPVLLILLMCFIVFYFKKIKKMTIYPS